jgi:hypothetical protein
MKMEMKMQKYSESECMGLGPKHFKVTQCSRKKERKISEIQ